MAVPSSCHQAVTVLGLTACVAQSILLAVKLMSQGRQKQVRGSTFRSSSLRRMRTWSLALCLQDHQARHHHHQARLLQHRQHHHHLPVHLPHPLASAVMGRVVPHVQRWTAAKAVGVVRVSPIVKATVMEDGVPLRTESLSESVHGQI